MRCIAFLAFGLSLVLPVPAAAAADGLASGGAGSVVVVTDGDTLTLDNGTEVRLVGIQAPKLPLGRPDFAPWPLADEARAALETLSLGRVVALSWGGRREDRHGRALAHLHRDDGLWLQGEMLSLGLARVYSFRDNRALVADMLALERAAREARLGIWGDPFYRVRDAHFPERIPRDRFELVEGRVQAVAVVRGRTYINFGEDWRSDFTATFGARVSRVFEREDYDLAALEGRRIRVRGWIMSRNGPMIELTHPDQIEVLSEP